MRTIVKRAIRIADEKILRTGCSRVKAKAETMHYMTINPSQAKFKDIVEFDRVYKI